MSLRTGAGSSLQREANGRDVARCAPLINRRWQRGGREDVGFIGYFAAAPGTDAVVHEMLAAAERWLGERGVKRVIAPFSGDAFHGFATQVDGFDEPPMFPLPWQPPYYAALFEAAGYHPEHPFWIYEIDFTSEQYRSVSRRAVEDARCVVRSFDKKRWDDEFETWRRLQNETFRDEWEFHPMTREEYTEFVADFKPVFDECQFLFAEVDGDAVGICWGMPDWTPLFRSFRGRMGPLQIARFILRAKRFERAGLIMIGVLDSPGASTSAKRSRPRSFATTRTADSGARSTTRSTTTTSRRVGSPNRSADAAGTSTPRTRSGWTDRACAQAGRACGVEGQRRPDAARARSRCAGSGWIGWSSSVGAAPSKVVGHEPWWAPVIETGRGGWRRWVKMLQ